MDSVKSADIEGGLSRNNDEDDQEAEGVTTVVGMGNPV